MMINFFFLYQIKNVADCGMIKETEADIIRTVWAIWFIDDNNKSRPPIIQKKIPDEGCTEFEARTGWTAHDRMWNVESSKI